MQRLLPASQRYLSYHNRQYFEYAGACGGWIDNFGYPFARGRVFDICEEDNGQYDDAAAMFLGKRCSNVCEGRCCTMN